MKVVLVELGATHHEVLIPQLKLLKNSNVEVELCLSEKFIKNNLDPVAFEGVKVIPVKSFNKNLAGLYKTLKLSKKLNSLNPDWVIFNTVAGPQLSLLSRSLKKSIKQAGIVHNTKKISKSKSVRSVCKRLKRIIVLNRELLNWIPDFKEKGFCFYPLTKAPHESSSDTSGNALKVVIPGQVETKRRDYHFLLEQIKKIPDSLDVTFSFLGNAYHEKGSGKELEVLLKDIPKRFGIKLLDKPVSEEEFRKEILSSDLILPLITPTCDGFENYLRYQISGTYNLSFSLKKPMMIHEAFSGFKDFMETSIIYSSSNFVEKLDEVAKNRSFLKFLETKLRSENLWKEEEISRSYLAMLSS